MADEESVAHGERELAEDLEPTDDAAQDVTGGADLKPISIVKHVDATSSK